MDARQGHDPAGRAGRDRRHAGRPAAPPSGRQGRGNAAGRAVRADRRERGRPLSVDLAAGIAGPVGHVARAGSSRVADLGHRARAWSGTCSTMAGSPTPCWLQDARFQQLYEQYQDAVLRAAREVDDAAVGFARTGEQIVLLAECGQGRAALARHRHPAVQRRADRLPARARLAADACSASRTTWSPRRGSLTQSLIGHLQGHGRRLGAGTQPARARRRDARNHGAGAATGKACWPLPVPAPDVLPSSSATVTP